MLELLGFACRACSEGVTRVHIVNGEIGGVILKELFSSRGCGTMVYTNQHENIRQMKKADIPDVLRIMQPFVEKEILLSRTEEDLTVHLLVDGRWTGELGSWWCVIDKDSKKPRYPIPPGPESQPPSLH